jgi:tRNA(fMet)-specific endonuclease VapC
LSFILIDLELLSIEIFGNCWDLRQHSAVSLEEQYGGRLAQIRKAQTPETLVAAYDRILATFALFSQLEILAYDLTAADLFKQFRQAGIRIGTQDLRIASLA